MQILERLSEPLKIEEVDFRIQSINGGGYATILAYKDARVDMNRLDAVCGVNWQDDYKLIDEQLFCGIGIKIENDWHWRWDVGTESFTEKVKGRASDAFKRACFRWGIGRELYDYPTINIKLNQNEFRVDGNRAKATYNLKLKEWIWSLEHKDGKIHRLTAKDQSGTLRFDSANKKSAVSSIVSNEKPWLNIYIKNTKNLTPEMTKVYTKMKSGAYTSIQQIREHYNISKVNVSTIEAWFVKLKKEQQQLKSA